jgi:hypothetical protein
LPQDVFPSDERDIDDNDDQRSVTMRSHSTLEEVTPAASINPFPGRRRAPDGDEDGDLWAPFESEWKEISNTLFPSVLIFSIVFLYIVSFHSYLLYHFSVHRFLPIHSSFTLRDASGSLSAWASLAVSCALGRLA